jgi:hypothetical protein
MKNYTALAVVVPLLVLSALGDDSQDKSQYNLFQPTPSDLMRPLNSDQFDNVLDAHTLDAGHLQIESSLVNYYTVSTHYSFSGLSYRFAEDEYSWGPRFRVGLMNNIDFEVNPTYSIRSANYNGAYSAPFVPAPFDYTKSSSAFGDIGLGPKFNLWGNDDGPTALAIHPFLSIPTHHGGVLGGLEVPFGWNLPCGLYLKVESQIDVTGSRTHYLGFYDAVSVHKSVCSHADVYWYLDANVTSESSQSWYGYTGFGATYTITRDLQLFGGLGFGLNSSAYDYNPRFGVIYRL